MNPDLGPSIRSYTFEVPIAAEVARVWRALVEEIDAWWLPDFRMVADDSRIRLEARGGGALMETAPSGSLEWYRVQLSLEGRALTLQGFLAPAYGGPGLSTLELRLSAVDQGTRLEVTDTLFGRASDALMVELEKGWRRLFTEGLAAHCAR